MTGGMAFVHDADEEFPARVNGETVIWQRVETVYWQDLLKGLVEEHARETQSRFAQQLLGDWPRELGRFWPGVPKEMLQRLPEPLTAVVHAAAGED
jgi:glutamate synthase (NADPH) large chain